MLTKELDPRPTRLSNAPPTFWAANAAGFITKPRAHLSRKENSMNRTACAITGACCIRISLWTSIGRAVKRMRHSSLLLAALSAGLCQASLGQDYILEAPGSAPPAASVSGGARNSVSERSHFRWQERHAVGALQCSGQREHHRTHFCEPDYRRCQFRCPGHCQEMGEC